MGVAQPLPSSDKGGEGFVERTPGREGKAQRGSSIRKYKI